MYAKIKEGKQLFKLRLLSQNPDGLVNEQSLVTHPELIYPFRLRELNKTIKKMMRESKGEDIRSGIRNLLLKNISNSADSTGAKFVGYRLYNSWCSPEYPPAEADNGNLIFEERF